MTLAFFDDASSEQLLPFTYTRSSADIRNGILTNRERWEKVLGINKSSTLCFRLSVQSLYNKPTAADLWINGRLLPDDGLLRAIQNLSEGQKLVNGASVLVSRGVSPDFEAVAIEYEGPLMLNYPEDIFKGAHKWISYDFEYITQDRKSQALSSTNTVIGTNPIFIEEGVKAEAAIFNTTEGPIYLGKDSEVMEGSLIRGPFALGEHSVLKMGAKIYGATSFGPHVKVGGEVNNSIIFGFSNKAHDGFLGNSVIGEWCNLGADTNNSNLKNNYDIVKLWDFQKSRFRSTGLQFCGLFMGDHAKAGINTMFNTGTVVGVGSNVFGSGFPRNFIPCFSWGGAAGFEVFQIQKFLETANRVLERRSMKLSEAQIALFTDLFNETQSGK